MTSLKNISMSELAKGRTGLGLVKSGVSKDKGERTPFVDPFTLDVTFPIEITGDEIGQRPSGTPQVVLSVSIVNGDGTAKKAGKLWVDLPINVGFEGMAMDAEQEAIFMQRSGEKFLRFLRAIDPEQWNVFASIDKSDPTKWIYIGFDGKPMDAATRTQRANEIDAAVVGMAEELFDGSVSLAGSCCMLTKKPNPNNPKYPYVNFSAVP